MLDIGSLLFSGLGPTAAFNLPAPTFDETRPFFKLHEPRPEAPQLTPCQLKVLGFQPLIDAIYACFSADLIPPTSPPSTTKNVHRGTLLRPPTSLDGAKNRTQFKDDGQHTTEKTFRDTRGPEDFLGDAPTMLHAAALFSRNQPQIRPGHANEWDFVLNFLVKERIVVLGENTTLYGTSWCIPMQRQGVFVDKLNARVLHKRVGPHKQTFLHFSSPTRRCMFIVHPHISPIPPRL
ncbi:hypothetical protein E4U19_004121 [Claviceps sp. Clav32 group G5]|nr:hypothetical protein E4U19_004121 [Claviceps sp. Clav32 group G5]